MKNEELKKMDDLFTKLSDNDVTEYVKYRINSISKYSSSLESYLQSIDPNKPKQDDYFKLGRPAGYYNLIINNNYNITITSSPTANCQFLAIGSFERLLEHCSSKEQLVKVLDYVVTKITSKPMIFVDVHQNYCDRVDSTFKDCVKMKSKFTSTNNSERCIYLLHISKFLNK